MGEKRKSLAGLSGAKRDELMKADKIAALLARTASFFSVRKPAHVNEI